MGRRIGDWNTPGFVTTEPPPREPPEPATSSAGPQGTGAAPRRRSARAGALFGLGLGALALLLVARELAGLIGWLMAVEAWLGWAVAALCLATLAAGIAWTAREWRAIARLRSVTATRARAAAIAAGASATPDVEALFARLERAFAESPQLADFRRLSAAQPWRTPEERLRRFAELVVRPADQAALAAVRRHATEIGFIAALSPFAMLDAVLVGWRIARLLRVVAVTYGHAPGAAASTYLMWRALGLAATAAAATTATDALGVAIGHKLSGVVAGRAAEGVLVSYRAARLGLAAIELCRPIPFAADEAPGVRSLLAEVTTRIGQTLFGGDKEASPARGSG